MFQNRVSVRDFPTYQCISSERAREVATKVVAEHEHVEEKEPVVREKEQEQA